MFNFFINDKKTSHMYYPLYRFPAAFSSKPEHVSSDINFEQICTFPPSLGIFPLPFHLLHYSNP